MSYILDALKRADAERGGAPGAADPVGVFARMPAPGATVPAWRAGAWRWVLPVVAVLAGLGIWLAWPAAPSLTPSPTPTMAPTMDSAPGRVPTGATDSAPPSVAPAPMDMAAAQLPPLPRAETASATPLPETPAPAVTYAVQPQVPIDMASGRPPEPILMPERSDGPAGAARPADTDTGMPGASGDSGQSAPSAGQLEAPTPVPAPPRLIRSLPPQATRPSPATASVSESMAVASNAPASAPPIKVTGVTYSDNPAHRMLIANGKVVLEGREIEPGLTLEVITPHSAVLNHRGSRYNINY